MTYLNPVQAAIDLILDLDVPDEQLADALSAQLAHFVGRQETEPTIELLSSLH